MFDYSNIIRILYFYFNWFLIYKIGNYKILNRLQLIIIDIINKTIIKLK